MGWSSWYTFGRDIDEQKIRDVADRMFSSGLAAAGYVLVEVDDGWMASTPGPSGEIIPDPIRFPSGIRSLADYCHARGLKLGMYSSVGETTCQGLPGSYGREQQFARQLADWRVDMLKYDWCGQEHGKPVERFQIMSKELLNCGRPILYEIVGGRWADWGPPICNDFRIDLDYGGQWERVEPLVRKMLGLSGYQRPGFWPDPDNLHAGQDAATETQQLTELKLWAMTRAPLVLGRDPRGMTDAKIAQLTDPGIIAANQSSGKPRAISWPAGDVLVIRRDTDAGKFMSVTNFSRKPHAIKKASPPGCDSCREVLGARTYASGRIISVSLRPDETLMLRCR
jgi:alpha-galactosidase